MTTVNRCMDAAKACNVDDLCQKLRTEYVSTCIKPFAKSGLCNRPKCNKALRRFFDRVPADYTHELLFCPCTDTACVERRRQTIVPSCSYESAEKPNCIKQMRICEADYVCRSGRSLASIVGFFLSRPQQIFELNRKLFGCKITAIFFSLMIHFFTQADLLLFPVYSSIPWI